MLVGTIWRGMTWNGDGWNFISVVGQVVPYIIFIGLRILKETVRPTFSTRLFSSPLLGIKFPQPMIPHLHIPRHCIALSKGRVQIPNISCMTWWMVRPCPDRREVAYFYGEAMFVISGLDFRGCSDYICCAGNLLETSSDFLWQEALGSAQSCWVETWMWEKYKLGEAIYSAYKAFLFWPCLMAALLGKHGKSKKVANFSQTSGPISFLVLGVMTGLGFRTLMIAINYSFNLIVRLDCVTSVIPCSVEIYPYLGKTVKRQFCPGF